MTPAPPPAATSTPIHVALLEIESLPSRVTLPDGCTGMWALVRARGRPRGMVRLAADGGGIDGEAIRQACAQLPGMPAQPPLALPERPPLVSVVVSTVFNRREDLTRCLASLAVLRYPSFEILLVDNRPHAVPALPDTPGVRVIHEPAPGLSHARNAALAAARGEIVAFTDDDVRVDPDWLRAIVARLQRHPEEAAVTGIVVPAELETEAQLALEEYYGSFGPRTMIPVSHRLRRHPRVHPLAPATVDAVDDDGVVTRSFPLYAAGLMGAGANFAARTELLRSLGGFDPMLGPGTPVESAEDLDMFARILWRGARMGFEPAALVHHRHRSDADGLRRQITGYGIGQTALVLGLIARDPRHLGAILGSAPQVARAVTVMSLARVRRRRAAAQPAQARVEGLAAAEVRGMIRGLALYGRTRRRHRRIAVSAAAGGTVANGG